MKMILYNRNGKTFTERHLPKAHKFLEKCSKKTLLEPLLRKIKTDGLIAGLPVALILPGPTIMAFITLIKNGVITRNDISTIAFWGTFIDIFSGPAIGAFMITMFIEQGNYHPVHYRQEKQYTKSLEQSLKFRKIDSEAIIIGCFAGFPIIGPLIALAVAEEFEKEDEEQKKK